MFNLGTMCALGQGAEQDVAAAAEWYKLAAEKELPGAQFAYANYLLTGQGVEKDEEQAFIWAEAAALQGHAKAQEALPFYRQSAGK